MREGERKWEGREERERGREGEITGVRKGGKTDGSWREREKERLTIARRQVARSPLAADKVNFL